MADLCSYCSRPVKGREHALQCDTCDVWQHRLCKTGINLKDYRALSKGTMSMTFTCHKCQQREDLQLEEATPLEPPVIQEKELQLEEATPLEPPVIQEKELQLEEATPLEPPVIQEKELQLEEATPLEPPVIQEKELQLEEATPLEPPVIQEGASANFSFGLNEWWNEDIDSFQPPMSSTQLEGDDESKAEADTLPYLELLHPGINVPAAPGASIAEEIFKVLPTGSKRGEPLLLGPGGYSYNVKRTTKNSRNWRCSVRPGKHPCPATVVEKGGEFTPGKQPHNHIGKPNLLLHKEIRCQLQAEVSEPLHKHKSAPQVVEEVMLNLPLTGSEQLPSFAAEVRAANRKRAGHQPKHPQTIDFELNNDHIQKDFLLDDIKLEGARHLIFSSAFQRQLLERADEVFVDATFKLVRKPWTQLLSIHVFVKHEDSHKQVPLVYALMSRRTTTDYIEVLESILKNCPEFSPEKITLDFEAAMWSAIREKLPTTVLHGCSFHWSQCVFRKIKAVGLQGEFLQHGATHEILKRLLALPLLPRSEIKKCWMKLKLRSTGAQMDQVFSYVQEQWFTSQYPIASWCSFGLIVRSNNDVEGYHNRINTRFGTNRSMYALIDALAYEAQVVVLKTQLVRSHALCSRARTAFRQERLFKVWSAWEDGEISSDELLVKVADHQPF